MGVKSFKATTSALRGTKLEDRSMLEKKGGPKRLSVSKNRKLEETTRVRLL